MHERHAHPAVIVQPLRRHADAFAVRHRGGLIGLHVRNEERPAAFEPLRADALPVEREPRSQRVPVPLLDGADLLERRDDQFLAFQQQHRRAVVVGDEPHFIQ